MNTNEQKELHKTIDVLIGKANSFDRIVEYFETDREIKKIYEQTRDECIKDGCFGSAVIYISTIEKLLERIDV